MTMTQYFIIVSNGCQSSHYFRTAQEAQAAADWRNRLMGGTYWTIRPIWSSDNRRPYGIVKSV